MSCEFIAEGAVRCPESGRLIPKPAQSRLARACSDNLSGLNSRVVRRCWRHSISGLPPFVWAGGKTMAGSSSARRKAEGHRKRRTVKTELETAALVMVSRVVLSSEAEYNRVHG